MYSELLCKKFFYNHGFKMISPYVYMTFFMFLWYFYFNRFSSLSTYHTDAMTSNNQILFFSFNVPSNIFVKLCFGQDKNLLLYVF